MKAEILLQRFHQIRKLIADPGFVLSVAEAPQRGTPVQLQQVWCRGLSVDSIFLQHGERLRSLEMAWGAKAPDLLLRGDEAILVRELPKGRYLSAVTETQRDEVYLQWLRSALRILGSCHQVGLFHLAQNPWSWFLESGGEGPERLRLLDLPLFSDLPLGARMVPEAVMALAPELIGSEAVDGRADLYAFACLLLRQRSPRAFDPVQTLPQWLDLHLGGRVANLVPKTPTPLNQLLRRMLQRDPAQRPANAAEAWRAIAEESETWPDANSPPEQTRDWARRRQATLNFSLIHHLQNDEDVRAQELLAGLPATLREAHPRVLAYLQARAARLAGDFETGRKLLAEAIEGIEAKVSPRLQVGVLLEMARVSEQPVEQERNLRCAWESGRELPDQELVAEVLLAQARHELSRGAMALALTQLLEAWSRLRDSDDVRCLEQVGLALAELLGKCGAAERAWPVLEVLLSKKELRDAALVELEAGLVSAELGRFAAAQEYFYQAKSRISSQKDLARLVWAGAHELRLWIAMGDTVQAARELKVLKSRARTVPAVQGFLEMLELKLALKSGAAVPAPSPWLEARFAGGAEAPFREWHWSEAESCELLAQAAGAWGKESGTWTRRAKEFRREMQSALGKLAAEGTPIAELETEPTASAAREAPLAPVPEPIPSETESLAMRLQRLSEEHQRLKEKLARVEAALALAQSAGLAPEAVKTPMPPPAALGDLAGMREDLEKKSIVASLRRHLGNRVKAAQELNIHRRTLFEKIRRYDLSEADFMPSPAELEATLAECRGNKGRAAERLGMSRSSFYRWLKDLKR